MLSSLSALTPEHFLFLRCLNIYTTILNKNGSQDRPPFTICKVCCCTQTEHHELHLCEQAEQPGAADLQSKAVDTKELMPHRRYFSLALTWAPALDTHFWLQPGRCAPRAKANASFLLLKGIQFLH